MGSSRRTEPSGAVGAEKVLRLHRSPGPEDWGLHESGTGAGKEGLCLVFKPQTGLFQNYPPRGTQKPNTSSISMPLVPDEESLSLPKP